MRAQNLARMASVPCSKASTIVIRAITGCHLTDILWMPLLFRTILSPHTNTAATKSPTKWVMMMTTTAMPICSKTTFQTFSFSSRATR